MLQRYHFSFIYDGRHSYNEMIEDGNGEYVKYEDIEIYIKTILQLKPIMVFRQPKNYQPTKGFLDPGNMVEKLQEEFCKCYKDIL